MGDLEGYLRRIKVSEKDDTVKSPKTVIDYVKLGEENNTVV